VLAFVEDFLLAAVALAYVPPDISPLEALRRANLEVVGVSPPASVSSRAVIAAYNHDQPRQSERPPEPGRQSP
jgi:hypothetical protein